ncbi:MAG: hypothetical protein WBG37_13015 [Desulfobacterales bacterium]
MAFISDMGEHKKALALAGEVQRSLHPQENPRVDGLDIAGRSVSYGDATIVIISKLIWRRVA